MPQRIKKQARIIKILSIVLFLVICYTAGITVRTVKQDKKISTQRETIADLNKDYSKLSKKYKKATDTLDEYKAKKDELESQVVELDSNLEELQTKFRKLQENSIGLVDDENNVPVGER